MGQQDDLLPWLTVQGNVMLGARLRGEIAGSRRRRGAARAGRADRRSGDQRPATLSGGQRQRAALARTLMEDRPVVLMDEPFSALDAITRARLQVLAAQLLAGRTVLLVTHDPLEALRLGHRIHVMAGQPARIEPPILPAGDAAARSARSRPAGPPGRASRRPRRCPRSRRLSNPRPLLVLARPPAALAGAGLAHGRAALPAAAALAGRQDAGSRGAAARPSRPRSR